MTLHPKLEEILAARGITPDGRDAFFDPSLKRLARASDIPNLTAAAEAILPFVARGDGIVVFGDYDCDGVCASAILTTALRRLGAKVDFFIPNRFTEGYGMTAASLVRLGREFPQAALVVTVDNGVNAVAEVAALKARGVSVVVTDHHLPGPELPAADALVDPKVASAPGCDNLCGAGVAFFLVSELMRLVSTRAEYAALRVRAQEAPKFGLSLLVLAGVATVADAVALLDQNRILVAQSLAHFAKEAPVGLIELVQRASRRVVGLTSRDYGFALAPRINAAGRMESADVACELLALALGTPLALVTPADRESARAKALAVDNFNVSRKSVERDMDAEARKQFVPGEERPALVVSDAGLETEWHKGVSGILASRLMEDVHVPVAVIAGEHGSARAPQGYNLRDALTAASSALTRFGGHAAAAGFSLKEGCLDEFKRLFGAACAAQRERHPEIADEAGMVDAWLDPEDLTLELQEQMRVLEPFGEGNPEPVFGLQRVRFRDVRPLGQEGSHLQIDFIDRRIPRALWWGKGREVERLRKQSGAAWDVYFHLIASDYGTFEPHLELQLVDVRPSAV